MRILRRASVVAEGRHFSFCIPPIRRRHLMWPSAPSDGIAGNSCWLNISVGPTLHADFFKNCRPSATSSRNCGKRCSTPTSEMPIRSRRMWPKAEILIFFVGLRPRQTWVFKPGDRCGRRPTLFFQLFFFVGLRPRRTCWVLNRTPDVAEGPHFIFTLFFRRPSATPYLLGFEPYARCGRRPTFLFPFVFVGLRPRRTWVLKPGDRCGRRPPFYLFVFLPASATWVLKRTSDVVEGPHLFIFF